MTLPLHARIDGAGPPVLVLHGFTGSSESMSGIAAGLRDRWRVVRLDLIGHGASPAPHDGTDYTLESCIDQMVGALDRTGIRAAHVIGYSMGGRAALALAARRPERVHSAILVGASAGLADPAARAERCRADEALAARIEQEGLEAFVDHWMTLPLFETQHRLGPEAFARARAQRLRNRPHGLANSLRGMGAGAQPPLHDALGNVRVPVRLVAGGHDAKFAAIARELAPRFPCASVDVISGVGHACHIEAPIAFLRAARVFFEEVERGANWTPPENPMHAGAHS